MREWEREREKEREKERNGLKYRQANNGMSQVGRHYGDRKTKIYKFISDAKINNWWDECWTNSNLMYG